MRTIGQVLLLVAALSGLVTVLLGHMGIFGHSHLGSVDGRQAEALTLSLLGGFALAAWRPLRLAAGLLPVAVLASAITLGLSAVEVTSGQVSLIDELSHFPLLVGALGAFWCTKAGAAAERSAEVPAPTAAPGPRSTLPVR